MFDAGAASELIVLVGFAGFVVAVDSVADNGVAVRVMVTTARR